MRHAFTLIELLVVVTIIALLLAMLLPVIGMVRTSAVSTNCRNNLKQLGFASLTYANDNEATIPAGISISGVNWYSAIAPYVNDTSSTNLTRTFKCPSAGIKGGSSHYSALPMIYAQMGRAAPARMSPMTLAELRPEVALLFDGTQDSTNGNNARQMAFSTSGYDRFLGSALDNSVVINGSLVKDGTGFFTAYRHPGNFCNFVFADAHVQTYRFNQGLLYRQLVIVRANRKWEWESWIP